MEDCIFCKIIDGSCPSTKFYDDDDMIIIADIAPHAKKHYLAIPKKHCKYISEFGDFAALGRCFEKIAEVAPSLGLENGYRIIINQGDDAEQTVPHLHIHLLGGQKLGFPKYD